MNENPLDDMPPIGSQEPLLAQQPIQTDAQPKLPSRAELLAQLAALDKAEGRAPTVTGTVLTDRDEPLEAGMMKTATVTLALNKTHTITKTGITPAQLMLLTVMFFAESGGQPVMALAETEPVKRTSREEIARLKNTYGRHKTDPVFGPNSSVPGTFYDAYHDAIGWASSNPELESRPLIGRTLTAQEAAAAFA